MIYLKSSAFKYRSNMNYIHSLLIILIMLPLLVLTNAPPPSGRIVKSNGCGSTFSIDWALESLGEGIIIPCCNVHDTCYETCGKTQNECDNAFQICLNEACNQLNGDGFSWLIFFRRAACKRDGAILFDIVNTFGSTAYSSSQSHC